MPRSVRARVPAALPSARAPFRARPAGDVTAQ
jgi:hypothetical protein